MQYLLRNIARVKPYTSTRYVQTRMRCQVYFSRTRLRRVTVLILSVYGHNNCII